MFLDNFHNHQYKLKILDNLFYLILLQLQILNQLYETRKDRLEVSGIKISKDDFNKLAI